MYIDEAMEYVELIYMQQLEDNINQLMIITNPHVKKPQELFNIFNNELNRIKRRRNMDLVDDSLPEKGAFNKIRAIFGQGKK